MHIFRRTLEEVNEMLHMAKLSEADILPVSQVLSFHSDYGEHAKYKLLELDDNLLKLIQEPSARLYLKGEDDEDAVLCTQSMTYKIVDAETSNSLVLTRDLKFPQECKDTSQERNLHKTFAHGIFYNYIEVNQIKANLRKLRDLLSGTMYKGPEYEGLVNQNELYTLQDLILKVQASEDEIKNALLSLDYAIIDGKVRMFDFEYHFRVLSYMLKVVEENSWSVFNINVEETKETLNDLVPLDVLNALCDQFVEEIVEDGIIRHAYNEPKVCSFFAKVILKNAGKFHLNDFLQAWSDSVPEGMRPKEEMLYGIAIIDRNANPNVIRSYSEDSLPDNILERLQQLFQVKEKWSVPEITPYIE